jgi:hypothetical protein
LSATRGRRADRLSALRGRGFVFAAGLARFSPTNPAHRAFFLQKRAVAGASAPKFSFFQKQQTDAEQGESDKYQRNGNKENGKHRSAEFCFKDTNLRFDNFSKVVKSGHLIQLPRKTAKNFAFHALRHTLASKNQIRPNRPAFLH